MKINNQKFKDFIQQENFQCNAILIYGNDYGLVCERTDDLTKTFLKESNQEDFKASIKEFNNSDIIKEPRILFEETQSISLLSNKTIIKINNISDSLTNIIYEYLENPDKESLLLLQANNLSPSSSIRKLFENHPIAKIVPCYTDEIKSIDSLITSMLKKENISIDYEAKKALTERLGLDRLVSKTEIEKAILFAKPKGSINYNQIVSFVGDQTSINIEKLSDSTMLGDFKNTFSILLRLEKEDTPSIQIVKILLKQLQNLHRMKISVMGGINTEIVINNFKPPIYFKRKTGVNRQVKAWSLVKIIKALSMLSKAEIECKRSSSIQQTLVRQVIFSLCWMGSKNTI